MPNFVPIDFNPFEKDKEIEKIVAINESQREIWLSCIIGGEAASLAYNESISLNFSGNFSFPNFKKAFEKVVERHEALRSTVSNNGEHFIIYKNLPLTLEVIELGSYTKEEQATMLQSFLKDQMLSPIDLQDGPLFRVYVHQMAANQHYFTIVIHHIICDGWSTGIILENLSAFYNAFQNETVVSLPKVTQISTYAEAQFDYLNSEEFKKTEKFWIDLYKGDIPLVDLPTDFERGKTRTYNAARIDYHLPASLVNQLKIMGSKAGCSLVNTMLSLFEIFLAQQTRQSDIVVGLPAAGQLGTNNQELVGHCVNILPIKSKIDTSQSFLTYLKQRKSAFLDAYENQLFSFGQLLKNLNFKRDSSRIPLVPIVFNIDMGMNSKVIFDGLAYQLHSNPRAFETFEIFLNATGSEKALILEWTYNTNLFKESTIHKMIGEFVALLNIFVENPENPIGINSLNLPLQATVTLKQAGIYEGKDIIGLMNETALLNETKIAIRYKNESITYQQLYQKSNQLAQFLINNGIKSGDIVGLSTDRSIEMLIALVGILKTGAAYLPLDPAYPKDRIEFMLKDSGVKLLLLAKKYTGNFTSLVKEISIENTFENLPHYKDIFNKKIDLQELANIIYTSGTTGKPKGARTTHKNLANLMTSVKNRPGILITDKFLAITTISFDIAAVELFLPLLTGAEVIIASEEDGKDGRLLLQLIEKESITVLQATPSRWKMLLDAGWEKKYPLTVLTAGEALTRELAQQLLAKSNAVWNLYGPTETTIYSTVKEIKESDEIITIGTPVNNTSIYILDENNKPLPINSVGEIFIAGEGVADGYLNRPELTDQKFILDPFSNIPNTKMYATGDLGKYLDNGEIQCLGRVDHQVKIRGYRIELGEIEAVLVKQANIKQAIVVAKEDALSQKRLVAYVILNTIQTATNYTNENLTFIAKEITAKWKESLNEVLPDFMIPEQYISLAQFPLIPNGKIDRNAFPYPQIRDTIDQEEHTLLNDNEAIIANIWSEALQVEHLKPSDDFFELGGHSLLAVKVMVEIENKTGKKLPLSVLFNNATIEKLALQLKEKTDNEWEALVPIKSTGSKPPLFLIHGAGLNVLLFKSIAKHFDEDQPVYGIQALGMAKKTDIPKDISGIAAKYIEEMLVVNPNGPFAIVGYSLGGVIAFEMAKQLKELGKEIILLGIMDTYVGMANLKKAQKYERGYKKMGRQIRKIPFLFTSFLNYPTETLNYQYRYAQKRVKQLMGQAIPSEKNILSMDEQIIYDRYNQAYEKYSFDKLDVNVNLFRVQKRLYYLDDLVYLGWDKVASHVEIYTVPGDHKTFLYEPNDKQFAIIMQNVLNQKNEK